tara:strand:- start:131 stop:376 length:246 start_codon:yes stop_codon:yes gene_type:complete
MKKEIQIKFKIAVILQRPENSFLDQSQKLTDIYEVFKEQLTLTDVSQQRELLLDFWMKMPKTHKHKGVAEHYIDNYLKSNN